MYCAIESCRLRVKGKMYKCVVRPAIMYGMETVDHGREIECKVIRKQIEDTSKLAPTNCREIEELLSRQKSEEHDDNRCPKPSIEEVKLAMKQMHNGCPGTDGITAEIWKGPRATTAFYLIITKVFENGNLPTEWNISKTIALPKKKGFRTISLIQTAAKIYAKIICNRLRTKAKEFVGETQCRFVCGRSTSDAIFKVDRIREACVEFRRTKILTLIDFTKAFDKIKRLNIEALKMMKVHAGLIWRIAMIMYQTEQRTDDGIAIKTMHDVRQGCCLSPTLFIITMKLLIDQLGIPS